MDIDILKKINNEVHLRDSIDYYMDYFEEKYNIEKCKIIDKKKHDILYLKGKDKKKYKNSMVLRSNSYEYIIFYMDKNIKIDNKEKTEDIELLKIMVSNIILYKTILNVSKSRLQKQKQVETLMEISRELIFMRDEENIFSSFIFAVMGQVMISKVGIYLSENEKNFQLKIQKGFDKLPDKIILNNPLKKVINLDDDYDKDRFPDFTKLNEEKVNLIVPMQYLNETRGLAVLGYKMDKENIPKSEYDFLFSLATNVIFAVENSKLIQESIEKKRMEQELQLAKDIQKNILPNEIPDVKNWDLHGINIPSREVGGDYFYIKKIKNKLCFVIADVTGKSVPAALLVSTLHSAFSILTQSQIELEKIVDRLNYLIFNNTSSEQFITFFIGYINLKNDKLKYINAGHNPPFLIRKNNNIVRLKKGGMILGIMPDTNYEMGEEIFDKGDLFSCFTDGITEITDQYGNEFMDENLKKLLIKNKNESSKTIVSKIIEKVDEFKSNNVVQDDMTLIIGKRDE